MSGCQISGCVELKFHTCSSSQHNDLYTSSTCKSMMYIYTDITTNADRYIFSLLATLPISQVPKFSKINSPNIHRVAPKDDQMYPQEPMS